MAPITHSDIAKRLDEAGMVHTRTVGSMSRPARKAWPVEHTDYLCREWPAGTSAEVIAAHVGRTLIGVRRMAHEMGLKRPQSDPDSEWNRRKREAIERTAQEIASHSRSVDLISRALAARTDLEAAWGRAA